MCLGPASHLASPMAQRRRGWVPASWCWHCVPWKLEGGFIIGGGKWMPQDGWRLQSLLVLFYYCRSSGEHRPLTSAWPELLVAVISTIPYFREIYQSIISWNDSSCKQMMMDYLWELLLLYVVLLEGNNCQVVGSCRNPVRAEGLRKCNLHSTLHALQQLHFWWIAVGLVEKTCCLHCPYSDNA